MYGDVMVANVPDAEVENVSSMTISSLSREVEVTQFVILSFYAKNATEQKAITSFNFEGVVT
jgi:hypothetical protein